MIKRLTIIKMISLMEATNSVRISVGEKVSVPSTSKFPLQVDWVHRGKDQYLFSVEGKQK